MKKSLIISGLFAASMGAYAQGTVNWNDHLTSASSGFEVHIYQPQLGSPQTEVIGNSAIDIPAGSTVYTGGLAGGSSAGTLANGADITVQLYAAPGNVVAGGLAGLSPVSQYIAPLYSVAGGAGLFKAPAINNDPGIPGGSASLGATIELVAWYNGGGLYPTLASAKAAGQAWGTDNALFVQNLGVVGSPPNNVPQLNGLQSFSLVTTPEPSTIALGVIGAASFLIRRRK